MQMFVLNTNPRESARNLCDAHVRVICREITMLLSTWYYHNVNPNGLPYKPMSINQPLIIQFKNPVIRKWALENAEAIFFEFIYRFGKEHASLKAFEQLQEYADLWDKFDGNTDVNSWVFVGKDIGIFTGLSLVDVVYRYRRYYEKKIHEMKVPCLYTKREPPDWLDLREGRFVHSNVYTYTKFSN